jgi:lipopolysaccharide/colanic/teichoic acid biosynthesis glycosyltransferase
MRSTPGKNRAVYAFLKRSFDLVGAVVGLVVLSPLFAVVALAVKLDSSGPVFFRQRRIGQGGEPFTLFKFRTMQADVDESIHREYMEELVQGKADSRLNERGESVYLLDDPRVTRVGRILRKTSIDEFPNLLNVLRGEMSLVGPRPPIPYEVEMYDEQSKHRLDVKPGVTGLAQVEGRGTLTFQQMVELDLAYIEEQSFGLDLKIIFRTIPSVLKKRGV